MTSPQSTQLLERVFKIWEYHVSHGQLLIRSPKGPAAAGRPERTSNIDLVFQGVEYLALPAVLRGIELSSASEAELVQLTELLGRPVETRQVSVLVSEAKRFAIVAVNCQLSEHDADIFASPF